MDRLRCSGENSGSNSSSIDQKPGPENAVLKAAWFSSELLGIVASFFRQPIANESAKEELEIDLSRDGFGAVDRSLVAETIRQDYGKSYFVTGSSNELSFLMLTTLVFGRDIEVQTSEEKHESSPETEEKNDQVKVSTE